MTAFTPVIRSLLDTDLYKFTMWQPFLHRLPANQARYRFVCRNRPAYPLASLKHEVEAQIEHLCGLRFTEEELACLSSKRYLKSDFIDYLRIFHFQHRYIDISADGDDLLITAQGPQIHVMGFEIFVLAIVNELYFRRSETPEVLSEARRRLQAKIKLLDGIDDSKRHAFSFFDFRHATAFLTTVASRSHQYAARGGAASVQGHIQCASWQLGLTAIGTMAHEYLQTFQAVGVQLRHFQDAALESWVQEYRGDLGVALTDVVGMDAFLADFDLYFSKLFDGLRHDSGDPIEWGEKALRHYESQRIDPHTKRLVFSDGLDLPRAIELHSHFADRVGCAFGIGTNLTNDTGLEPLNIVMKLTECNGQPVAKISDSPGKTLCSDETFLAYLRQVFGVT